MLSFCLSGAIYQDELSLLLSCLSCLSVCLSQETKSSSWTDFCVWLCFGRGALTKTLEGLSGTRQWGEIERALKRLWIPVPSPLLTGSSSLLALSHWLRWMVGIVGMDGSQLERRLWVATPAKQHQQGINGIMKGLGRQYEHERAYMFVYSCMFSVYLYPYGWRVRESRKDVTSAEHCKAPQGRLGLKISA